MTVQIRKAKEGDEEKLAKQFWHPLAVEMVDYHQVNELKEDAAEDGISEFKSRIEDEKYRFFFLEVEGEEVAYISIEKGESASRKIEDYVTILDLYVKEGFRGQGYGTKLIEKAREYAEEVDADYMMVSAEWKNDEAQEFYRKNGFEKKKVKFIQMVDRL